MKRQTGSFTARDPGGKEYRILVFTEIIDASTRAGSATLDGLKALRTEDGLHVNRIAKGHYR
ncbi:MAG: hypothetical protein NTW87_29080, partial [Planctomycetota bacterium]|nr:hypothetical protein [Planctomycetota bacterium]